MQNWCNGSGGVVYSDLLSSVEAEKQDDADVKPRLYDVMEYRRTGWPGDGKPSKPGSCTISK
jgi:hypothetical protein